MASVFHTPVLLEQTVSLLITTDGVYVDATLGGGGHAEAILQPLGPEGKLVGIDADHDAIEESTKRLERFGQRAVLKQENFLNVKSVLSQLGISKLQGILFDLGVSSFQFDVPEKGFSYRADETLDMRLDHRQGLSALDIINESSEQDLTEVIWRYGEERLSRKVARAIVLRRKHQRIETTGQLADIVRNVAKGRFVNKTLSRVFQALRIKVNNELENLQKALEDSIDLLAPGGRLVVISYHSLEDRIVKETFRKGGATRIPSTSPLMADIPVTPILKILTKKPLKADKAEIEINPRARSAKLRAAEKI